MRALDTRFTYLEGKVKNLIVSNKYHKAVFTKLIGLRGKVKDFQV